MRVQVPAVRSAVQPGVTFLSLSEFLTVQDQRLPDMVIKSAILTEQAALSAVWPRMVMITASCLWVHGFM